MLYEHPSLDETLSNFEDVISEFDIRTILSLFSGGRDSLVVTHITWNMVQTLHLDFKVIHVNTTCALPGVQEYVKEICNRLKWPLRVLDPKIDFWTLVEKWGAPTPRRRWCCYHLKLEPVREYTKTTTPPRLHILGLRARESAGRLKRAKNNQLKQLYRDFKSEAWAYNPIFWWKEEDVEEYIKEHDLPVSSTYENLGTSGECFCGAFKTEKQLLQVKANYPRFFEKLVKLESKFHNGGSLFYISGKRIYAKDLMRRKMNSRFK